jgi:muconolactone delta-isomerase
MPPDQQIHAIETAVIPSFKMLAQLEKEGKLKGGTFPGERAGASIIEADSFEELDTIMNQLPFFGLVKWQIKALIPMSSTVGLAEGYVQRFRQMTQGGQQG